MRSRCAKHPTRACYKCRGTGWSNTTTRCKRAGSPCHGTMPNFTDRKPCLWCATACSECGAVRGSIACERTHAA